MMVASLLVSALLELPPAVPTFEDYPVPPDLTSHPGARRYRTVLRAQAQKGPNFAGHYTLVTIGAGTSTVEVVVLDAKTGRVFFPKAVPLVQWAGWWNQPSGAQYRPTSRLLVVYGWAGEPGSIETGDDGLYGVSYFLWEGQDFRRLMVVKRDRGRPPQ